MAEFYRFARLTYLQTQPFTGDRLGTYAWYYHQIHPFTERVVYLFSSARKLLSVQNAAGGANAVPDALPSRIHGTAVAFLGLSLCARNFSEPGPADEILLFRENLLCQSRNIPVLDMILVHRGGYIPLSQMNETNGYFRNPSQQWFL